MNRLNVNFENCFGIKKLQHEFCFNESNNVNVIYAKNGLMKTSFSRVFKSIQDGKTNEIRDKIYGKEPVRFDIKKEGAKDIPQNEIFVINSFEAKYESSSIASLLIDDSIKKKLTTVLELKNDLIKSLEKASGVNNCENNLFKDFNYKIDGSFLAFINELELSVAQTNEEVESYNFKYNDVFIANDELIKSDEFQNNIEAFITISDSIFEEYTFLDKGSFSFPKLKKVQKELSNNNYYVNQKNSITLNGHPSFTDDSGFKEIIDSVDERLKTTNEMKKIQKLLMTQKGSILRELIERNPDLVYKLQQNNLSNFKKSVWVSYIKVNHILVTDLKNEYKKLITSIKKHNIETTRWTQASKIFNDRFSLPCEMVIENVSSSIIGESLPKVGFKFEISNGDGTKKDSITLNRDDLDKSDTLSQGEKRALYLLNIIFDVEKRKKENARTLFIVDDIADSFDYKNKYAIIEYLNDIANYKDFFLIILSHNFDFYRTVCSRLGVKEKYKYIASAYSEGISLIPATNHDENPFKKWKEHFTPKNGEQPSDMDMYKKYFVSLIPFVRNLIEFGIDRKCICNSDSSFDNDFDFLTNLLHKKTQTTSIKVSQVKAIYTSYLGIEEFNEQLNDNDSIYELLLELANNIDKHSTELEHKLILAIMTRIKAEEFMMKKIEHSTKTFNWKNNQRHKNTGNGTALLSFIHTELTSNQTRALFDGFKQMDLDEHLPILERVNIMTPENIHLNSFMYEPILDMDITELLELYNSVKSFS